MRDITESGRYYSLEKGRGYGITLGTGWMLVIFPEEDLPGSFEVLTWDFMPEGATEINEYSEEFGEVDIAIRLALASSLSALHPSISSKLYIRT